MLKYKPYLQPK